MDNVLGNDRRSPQKLGSTAEKNITIKVLHEILGIVKLHNDKEWVSKLRERLRHLITENFGEHLVPVKARMAATPKNSKEGTVASPLHQQDF